jgi:hypothetical protein
VVSKMIERESEGSDLVERRFQSLTDLDEGKDAPLARLVRFWFSLPRPHGILPNVDDVGLMELTRLGVLGWFHVVDVHHDDPSKFSYDVFALRGSGGYAGIRLSDIGSKALQRALEHDLQIAKTNKFPLFQGVQANLASHSRAYRRISLPLASGDHDVTHLLVGVHFDR